MVEFQGANMIRKAFKKVFTVGALASAVGIAPIAAKAETVADALASAYEHSGLLQQNRALLRAADEDVAIAVAALRPVLNWSSSISRTYGRTQTKVKTPANNNPLFPIPGSTNNVVTDFRNDEMSFTLSAELLLYDFGATRLAVDAAKETVLATREALISVEQQILLRALQAYVNVNRAAETVALRNNALRLVQQELRAARDRFEVGEVTRTDVSLAEAQLAASRANLAAAQGDLMRANEEYAAVIGHKPRALTPITKLPAIEQNADKAKSIAVRTHPDMRRAQYEVSVADLNIRRAHAAMKPTASLSGNLKSSVDLDTAPNYTNSATVSLDFGGPIYQGGRLSALARQAQARSDASRGSLHVTRHNVAQNVGNSLATFRVAQASMEATQRQIRASRVAFRGVREEASLGQRTTLDVLTAEQDLLNAETAYTSAVADRTIAAYALLASMGLMTAEHLGLNVQRYDPAEYYNLIKNAPAKSIQGDKLDRVLRKIGK